MASYENKQMPFEIEKQNQNGVERESEKDRTNGKVQN
jgi:hypothetical protein